MLKIKSLVWVGILLVLSACGGQENPSLNSQIPVNSVQNGNSSGSNTVPGSGTSTSGLSTEEAAFLVKINALRSSLGLNSLSIDPGLESAARAHSAVMDAADSLAHNDPGAYAGSFNISGENIACGNADAEATYQQWYNSLGHYANMVDASYKFIGIARAGTVAEASNKTCPYYWTTDFGG